ncbi:NACHT, LRR and PYD domains-containing protein 3-like isoform X2 [Callorhinchus milii]|uniref:NACHT, LRR and PYD domains-containing protein 3-like isoform X2 n=1 Tax=Callorhinchus milii TaxID=7868 RepID=UPI001C3FAEA8|nr:NACHT, LRR and PYD domains-containing protein 3-like isoform X2 [Callorhinchus milii]
MYNGYQLFKLTQFYRDRIEQAIEEEVEAVSLILTRKKYFSQQEHQKLTELTHNGRKRKSSKLLLNLVLGKGSRAQRLPWESFVEMKHSLPKLQKIITEIQVQEFQRLHKESLQKQFERLEVKTILVKEEVKEFQLVDRYTELTIISDLRHRKLVEHELLARGRDHEEWRQKHLRGELEKIRTDKLFHSSFTKGSHLLSCQGSGSNTPAGTSTVVSGVAGIGKTTMVQKIVHDWATGKIYPQFHFVFIFKFRNLNTLNCRITLRQLILDEYPYLRDALEELWKHSERLLFIFDGLDEFRAGIDFADKRRATEPQHMCSDTEFWCEVSDIVYSLIQKRLLPGCSVLVTSRPTALHLLAKAQVSVWAEILGFVGEERRGYFQKFFDDQGVAAAVYSHVEDNELLFTMCYNPSYCWILALSLRPFFTRKQSNKQQVPTTITQLFSYYIYHILKHHTVEMEIPRDVIMKIGAMALKGVSQRNIVFSNEDLIQSDLQPSQFLSGFLTELVERENSEHCLLYTFPHLTIQEFVAALDEFLCPDPRTIRICLDDAERVEDGRFEIFLRFVAGLSSPRAAQPLEDLLGPFVHQTTCTVIDWLKEKVKAQVGDTKTVTGKRKLLNTLHYLFESQNQALAHLTLGSVQTLTIGDPFPETALRLAPIDCVVLCQAIGLCDTINLLDLTSCYIQDEGLQRLVPALHKCQELWLKYNNLGEFGVKRLCEALRKPDGKIQRLELGGNNLGDSGVKRLCEALRNPECKIQSLGLQDNRLTADCADDLASALNTNRSPTELYMNNNKLGDTGVKRLCEALRDPECKVQILELKSNNLTADCTEALASVLSTNHSLTELGLRSNALGDSGVKRLCAALRKTACKLQTLRLQDNSLTSECTEDLASALITNHSMTELNLYNNKLGDSGVKRLCVALRNPECKVQILRLQDNSLTADCTEDLASVLSTNHSLTELNLNSNKLEDSGVKRLCDALRNPQCNIQILELSSTRLTDGCTDDLVSALSTSRSLRILNLVYNSFTDASVPALRRLILTCTSLEEIKLWRNRFSSDGQNQLLSLRGYRAGLTVSV